MATALNLPPRLDEAGVEGIDSINPLTGTITQVPIREVTANDPVPEQILVRQIGLVEGPGGPFGFIGPDAPRPYSEQAFNRILDDLLEGNYAPEESVDLFNRPLDVNCSATTLFIFYLSNQRDWRFTRRARAITLGDFDKQEQQNYYGLRHVVDEGITGAPPTSDCRIAYFIAKKTSDRFAHPFNLNIELVYTTDTEGENTVPMVIDPDVRYPGGSGSE